MIKAITRVFQYIDYKSLKPAQFEKHVGLSNGYLGKQLARNADLGEGIFNKILDNCPDVNPIWLFTGRGEMLLGDIDVNMDGSVNEPAPKVYRLKTDRVYDEQSVPLYNIEAAAGIVTLFRDAKEFKPVDYIQVPNLPKCDGAVYISGDSMYPLLKSGDIVMYRQHDVSDGIIWGEMYLISYEHSGDDLTSVKYIKKSDKGDEYIKLVSQNQHHQDRDILMRKVRALALVKASIRINSMS